MTSTTKKPSKSFWIISSLALLWNLMGVYQYIQQAYMTDSFKAMYNEEQLNMILDSPSWATAAFAIAVFSGSLGSLALLLRKKIAHTLFIISFIAIVVQNIDALMRFNFSELNTMEISMTFMIPICTIFLIWFSKSAINKGWIK
jgi:hypothetical protein